MAGLVICLKGIAQFKEDIKNSWKRKLQYELKNEIDKTLGDALTVAASKEKWKDLVRGLRST